MPQDGNSSATTPALIRANPKRRIAEQEVGLQDAQRAIAYAMRYLLKAPC